MVDAPVQVGRVLIVGFALANSAVKYGRSVVTF